MSQSLISDSQKEFIVSSIKNDFRIDGRSNAQPQKYILKINNLDHLLGSCLLNIQTSQNEVHIYTGIKIKVEKISNTKKQTNSEVLIKDIRQRVSLELGCIKKLTEQQEQTRVYIEEYLNKYTIDKYLSEFEELLAIPQAKRHYLTISIQAYILSTPHISYLEYLHLCIKNAIQNIQMPQFTVAFNEITDQEVVDVQLVDKQNQPRNNQIASRKSSYKGLQGLKLVGILGQNYVLGMTVQEYQAVDSCLLIAFDQDKKVSSFESLKGSTKVQQLHQIIKFVRA